MITSRAFFNVNVGNFTLDWPMVTAVDPKVRPPETFRATQGRDGAGWIPFATYRKKPQVKAQLTYYLPGKAGSHDFKFGFERLYDSYQYGHNGTSGPIRYSYAGADPLASPDRIRFIDVGDPSTYGSAWTVGPNLDSHYSGYVQDRWAPNTRLTITLGVRIDRQSMGYGDATRKAAITDVTGAAQAGDGGRIFPVSTTVASHTFFTNTNAAARLGLTYDLNGKGRTVLKAFYGRYYNNLADGFSAVNPGDITTVEYAFKDVYGDHRYHGPENLGAFRFRQGGSSTPVDPNFKTPVTEEISGSFETQLPGESSARLTYVRKNVRQPGPFYGTNIIPAWLGQVTVPTRVTVGAETFNLLDVPDALAGSTDGLYTNYPDGDYHYDTIEVAYNKRLSRKFFVQTSADYQWRNDLRSALPGDRTTSPLGADPIAINFDITPNPAAPNRQKTTTYHLQFLGRYTFPFDIGVAANYRYQSGFPYARVIPDPGTLNLSNYGADFFAQNLNQNRSENVGLLNLRLDKGFPIGRAKVVGMIDLYNVMNADPVTNFNLNTDAFKRVIAVLDPRVLQVGVRLEF